MDYIQQDLGDLATCGWMEARNQGLIGCLLVMFVIKNRVGFPGFPKTIHEAIYEPNAFSWTIPTNPEYKTLPAPGDALYAHLLTCAKDVLTGNDDASLGAHYYANLETMDKGGWFERHISGPDGLGMPGHKKTLTFMQHTFYV